ncbi:boule-related [Brachionus plicatilis]|uniref:Boule-related n=1 Tax=Brachionus plicatilis TaxID=10195 RepID=A0A3M7PVM0_BRAPC|nr:boule-related [Brachionus plicatilis]
MYKVHIGGELIPNRIFVGGIPETTDEELREYLTGICGQNHIVDIKYIGRFRGSTKGICFVTFDSENEVSKFLNLNSDLIFKNTKLKISNAYRRYNSHKNYTNQNFVHQNTHYTNQVDIAYYGSPTGEESDLCIMTPTPSISRSEPPCADTVNEIASSSSASSASSQCQSEPNDETKQKSQVVSSASSVTILNSELTTLTAINQSEKDSIIFSSSSSASSNSSKSASSSNLNKSNETKLDGQSLDSNNNKNVDQKMLRKQPDTFRPNTQARAANFPRPNYQKSNRNFQTEPLTVQTSNSRSQSQMTSPFYYGNHSNPISPIKNPRHNPKQNYPRNMKNSEMLKINTNMNASNYVGSVIGAVYPDTKPHGPFSSGSKNYNLNSQSHSSVANAAETVASYANQTASVNSSIIPNTARPNSYPNEPKANQPTVQNAHQYMYPNFYYYTNPAALPISQNGIFVDPNLQRSSQMSAPATPHSFNPYYQTQTSTGSNSDGPKQNSNATSSQSTILNAFETATNNPNPIAAEQLDEMMQKSLHINQYESQQYTGPVYYLAQVPNSQYYAYYYAPNGAILGPSAGQSQVQIIAPIASQNSTSSQMNQSYPNQQNFAPQPQIMSQMYMQQQMMGAPFVQPNSQPMPFLQLPTISYLNSGQQSSVPQSTQQVQYQHTTQTSPKQNFPNNMYMYQYGSALTPKGASMMSSSSSQNRSAQNNQKRQNQKSSSQIVNKYSNRQANESQPSMISPILPLFSLIPRVGFVLFVMNSDFLLSMKISN